MTAARRTLEEIEALAAEATPGPWILEPTDPLCITREDPGWASSGQLDIGFTNDPKLVAFMNHDVGDDSTEWFASQEKAAANAALIAALPALLAIAQGQREALLAIWPFVEEDDGGFATPEYQAAIDQVRATLGIGTKK